MKNLNNFKKTYQIAVFGISGVGKDVIFAKIAKPQDMIISVSRLLMYHLGIINDFDSNMLVSVEKYKELEKVPVETIDKTYEGVCAKTIADLRKNHNLFLLGHLIVFANGHYFTPKQPKWVLKSNNVLLFKSMPEEILIRRKNDGYTRRSWELTQIIDHQKLIDKEWERIASIINPKGKVIYNHQDQLTETILKARRTIGL